jgi:hypothetical protein
VAQISTAGRQLAAGQKSATMAGKACSQFNAALCRVLGFVCAPTSLTVDGCTTVLDTVAIVAALVFSTGQGIDLPGPDALETADARYGAITSKLPSVFHHQQGNDTVSFSIAFNLCITQALSMMAMIICVVMRLAVALGNFDDGPAFKAWCKRTWWLVVTSCTFLIFSCIAMFYVGENLCFVNFPNYQTNIQDPIDWSIGYALFGSYHSNQPWSRSFQQFALAQNWLFVGLIFVILTLAAAHRHAKVKDGGAVAVATQQANPFSVNPGAPAGKPVHSTKDELAEQISELVQSQKALILSQQALLEKLQQSMASAS